MRNGLLALVAVTTMCGACESPTRPQAAASSATTPSPTPTPPSSPAPPAATASRQINVSGVVRDEAGVPLANTTVEVHYRRGDGASSPPSVCPFLDFCWFGVKTDGAGFYSATFHAVPAALFLTPGLVGVIHAFGGDDHLVNTQLLWPGPTDIVQNFWLRRWRTISAGQSTTVAINSDSSRCTDLEDLFALGNQCETVAVRVDAPGTLVVEARAADGGGAPTVYWYTSGDYTAPGVRTGPSSVSLVVYPGTVTILVGTPAGSARRFDVLTSMR